MARMNATTPRTPVKKTKALGPVGFWLNDWRASSAKGVTSPYTENAWVHAAVTRKGACIGSAPLRIYSGRRDDANSRKLLTESDPSVRLFARPSPLYQSTSLFFEAMSAMLDIYGEAPVVAINADGSPFEPGGVPAELYLLDPRQLKETVDKRTGLVVSWLYGERTQLTVGQVGLLKTYNPKNAHRGLSPLDSAQSGLDYDFAAQQFNIGFMRNGASPGGMLEIPGVGSEDKASSARAQWKDTHAGPEKAGRLGVLFNGAKYTQHGVKATDMQFSEMRDWSRAEVMAVLGVTKFEVGLVEDYNRASAVAAKAWMWENTLIPRLRSIEAHLWSWIFEPLSRTSVSIWAEFDLSGIEALRANLSEQVQQATSLATLYPINDVNERLGLGMPSVTYGDAPPPMLAPLDEPLAEPLDGAATAKPAAGLPVAAEALNGAQISSLLLITQQVAEGILPRDSAVAVIAVSFPLIPREQALAIIMPIAVVGPPETEPEPKPEPKPEPEAKSAVTTSDLIVRDIADITSARLKSAASRYALVRAKEELTCFKMARAYFRDAQSFVLANVAEMAELKSFKPTKTDLERALGSEEKWRAFMRTRAGKSLPKSWAAGFQSAGRELGFAVVEPPQADWMSKVTEQTARLVVASDGYRERIGDNLRSQWSETGITDLRAAELSIREEFGKISAGRAAVIARTEAGVALNNARTMTFEASGVTHYMWSSANDDLVRDSHKRVNGEIVRAGREFSNGLLYPQEFGAPAEEVVNCRCTHLGTEAPA